MKEAILRKWLEKNETGYLDEIEFFIPEILEAMEEYKSDGKPEESTLPYCTCEFLCGKGCFQIEGKWFCNGCKKPIRNGKEESKTEA